MTRADASMRLAITLAFLTLLALVDPVAKGLAACWTGESDFCTSPGDQQ